MSRDLDKLQRMLEQATAKDAEPHDTLDPETASLREAWLRFGELLEATQPAEAVDLSSVRQPNCRVRPRRTFFLNDHGASGTHPTKILVGLLAASLLVAVATMWMSRTTEELSQFVPHETAAMGTTEQRTAQVAAEPRWDDESLDEQIAQVGQNIMYARQEQYTTTDPFSSLRYGIEQMQKDLDGNKL